MRKFNVTVNGTSYAVEVEEVGGAPAGTAPVASAPAVAPAPAKVAVPTTGAPFKAPMPGTILSIAVANGAKVKKGDTVLTLEAMKMGNPIAADKDGTVTVTVAVGAKVNSGDVLFVIA